jgi:hypothetical protein
MPKSTRKAPTRKPRTAATKRASTADLVEAVRLRAYTIAEQRGAPGDPVQDWLRAEREVREGNSSP